MAEFLYKERAEIRDGIYRKLEKHWRDFNWVRSARCRVTVIGIDISVE